MRTPKAFEFSVPNGSWSHTIDILGTYSKYAHFVQITAFDKSVDVRLNGDEEAVITVEVDTTQVFSSGDLDISKLEFANPASGGTGLVQVLIGIDV